MFLFCFSSHTGIISFKNRRIIFHSSDSYSFRRKDEHVKPSRQKVVLEGDLTPVSSAPSSLSTPQSVGPVSALVRMIDYITKIQSILDAQQFATSHEDGGNVYFIAASFSSIQNIALKKRRKLWKLFGCSHATLD